MILQQVDKDCNDVMAGTSLICTITIKSFLICDYQNYSIQLFKILRYILAIKKERADRERDSDMIKERIDNERKEIQISVDKVLSAFLLLQVYKCYY